MKKMDKDIKEYTLEEFRAMEEKMPEGPFKEVIIVPMEEIHDSGWGCMKFILAERNEVKGVVSGYSDVVHINGIGGYGRDWESAARTGMVPRHSWSIDCLPGSGCLRLFCDEDLSINPWFGSDFEVFV